MSEYEHTEEELIVLDALKDAFNQFKKLEEQHPNHINEFVFHIHELQRLIAVRLARRCQPEIWNINYDKTTRNS